MDYKFPRSLINVDISGNEISGNLHIKLLPLSLVTFNGSSCKLSGELSFSSLGPNMVLVDISNNLYESVLTKEDFKISSSAKRTVIFQISDNNFFCPFPAKNDIDNVNNINIILLKSQCKTNFEPLKPFAIASGIYFNFIVLTKNYLFCDHLFYRFHHFYVDYCFTSPLLSEENRFL